MDKISVEMYLGNKSLLQLTDYIPYEQKVGIVENIFANLVKDDNGYKTMNTALLTRVEQQVFIEHCTNLNLSEIGSDGLNGYDELIKSHTLNEVIENISDEYNRFIEIMNMKLNDFYRYDSSVYGLINNKSRYIYETFMNRVISAIQQIDAEKIVSGFENILDIMTKNIQNGKKD